MPQAVREAPREGAWSLGRVWARARVVGSGAGMAAGMEGNNAQGGNTQCGQLPKCGSMHVRGAGDDIGMAAGTGALGMA